jgi:TRAP-type C4-dicarboxylate transport system permease small subunit
MQAQSIAAIFLLAVGALALGYGGFSYTRQTHQADVGPLHLAIDEQQRVNIPAWAGVAAIVVGGLLLVLRRKD